MRGALCNSSARLIFTLLFALPLDAQVSETMEVRVLELEVAVVDRAGKPVDGLTRDDFVVKVAGKPAAISNFFAVRRGAIQEEAPQPAGPAPAAATTSIPTTVVIFIDDTRLTVRGKKRAMDALKEFVRTNVGPLTTAMLVRWNGSLNVVTRPAERPGPLLLELDRIAAHPPALVVSERRALMRLLDDSLNGTYSEPDMYPRFQQLWREFVSYADRETADVERTLEALREATRLTGVFEGRKVLLYVSEGLPSSPGADLFDYWHRAAHAMATDAIADMQDLARKVYSGTDAMRYDRSRQFERLSREAQASSVAFFALDPAGVRGFVSGGVEDASNVARLDTMLVRANEEGGVRRVANETGGRFVSNENDLGRALDVISEQFTTYYSIGIRAPKRMAKIAVSVKGRPGLRVMTALHRRAVSREEELERGVRSRLYSLRAENPLGAAVSVGTPSSVAGRCVAPVTIDVPRPNVAIHFALLDERLQESALRTVTTPSMSLGLEPGRYVLSVAIDDTATGETSFLQREIDCPKPSME